MAAFECDFIVGEGETIEIIVALLQAIIESILGENIPIVTSASWGYLLTTVNAVITF